MADCLNIVEQISKRELQKLGARTKVLKLNCDILKFPQIMGTEVLKCLVRRNDDAVKPKRSGIVFPSIWRCLTHNETPSESWWKDNCSPDILQDPISPIFGQLTSDRRKNGKSHYGQFCTTRVDIDLRATLESVVPLIWIRSLVGVGSYYKIRPDTSRRTFIIWDKPSRGVFTNWKLLRVRIPWLKILRIHKFSENQLGVTCTMSLLAYQACHIYKLR